MEQHSKRQERHCQMYRRSCVIWNTLRRPRDVASMFHTFLNCELCTVCWFWNVSHVCVCVSCASTSVCRSMTALSVVTVAFPTEGCVDEPMEQDEEVCIHPPLQRCLIVSIARCFVILAEVRRSLLFATVQLLCLAQSACARCSLQCWRRLFSPPGPLCSMLCMARISPVVPRRFFCTHMNNFSKAVNRIIAILAQSVDKNQANFPQRSTQHPRNTCQPPASFPHHSTMTSAKHVPVAREFSTTLHETPA